MKKTILLLLLVCTGWITGVIHAQGFSMREFSVDIYLQKAGYFDVVETYDVVFNGPKHGLFRDFVTKFDFQDEKGKVAKRTIYISDVEVPGWKFEVTGGAESMFASKTTIKIGDKNAYVNGPQHYEIKYRVKNALIFTDSLVELYWNVKPSGWLTVFNNANIRIHGPEGSVMTAGNCFVYAGNQGDATPSTSFEYHYDGHDFSASSKENFISVPGQSITVLVKMPKAFIAQADFTPSLWQRYKWAGGILLLIGLLVGWVIKRVSGSRVTPVTSYYPPGSLDPAMSGVLIDNLTNTRDISCLLPYWGSKGVIRMEVIEKGDRSLLGDLKLIRLKELPADSAGYEYNLFQKIFLDGFRTEVKVSALRGVFGEPLQLLNKKSKEYYLAGRKGWMWLVMVISWLWAFFSISGFPVTMQNKVDINKGGFIAFIILNFLFFFIIFPGIVAYVTHKYRKKNEKGQQITAELLGFREFIKKAELDRIKILLKDDPEYFEKTMPYAVAFNLLKEWAGKFDGLEVPSPGWYSSSNRIGYDLNHFTHSFTQSLTSVQSSMVTSPSSGGSSSHSGGGSSGGGAGSGGGGSW